MIDIVNIGPRGADEFELKFKKYPESLMRLHHPTCGHCKAMEEDWKDLEKDLKSNYNGDVGVFDIHADALSNINEPALQGINGFPTILAIKGGKSTHYNGDRSKDDMLKFGLNHLNIKKKEKTLVGGCKKRRLSKTKRRRTRRSKKSRKSRKSCKKTRRR